MDKDRSKIHEKIEKFVKDDKKGNNGFSLCPASGEWIFLGSPGSSALANQILYSHNVTASSVNVIHSTGNLSNQE